MATVRPIGFSPPPKEEAKSKPLSAELQAYLKKVNRLPQLFSDDKYNVPYRESRNCPLGRIKGNDF